MTDHRTRDVVAVVVSIHGVDGDLTGDRLAGADGCEELELHRAREHAEVAADLRGERRGEEPLHHEPALLVGFGVDRLLVARDLAEALDVLAGEGAFEGVDVAHLGSGVE